MKNESL